MLLGGDGAAAGVARIGRPATTPSARAMGFCLFDNIAIAAQHALDAHGLQRVLIVDWDVHHGNGTNDIFHGDRRGAVRVDPRVAAVSRGPGRRRRRRGRGEGYTVNLPVPAGSGDETWVSLVEHVVRPLARAYEPELVLVSAGFDAHAEDPLAAAG